MEHANEERAVKPAAPKWGLAVSFIVVGFALGAGGIYVGQTDDAPGAGLLGLGLMLGCLLMAGRVIRNR